MAKDPFTADPFEIPLLVPFVAPFVMTEDPLSIFEDAEDDEELKDLTGHLRWW